MEIVSGYCDLCRAKEREMYGEVLSEYGQRHYEACNKGACTHPVFYVFNKIVKEPPIAYTVPVIKNMITSSELECNNIEEWYEEFEIVFADMDDEANANANARNNRRTRRRRQR